MAEKLKIIPLGGLNEIGKNMTVLEYGKDIIIVDCGLGFPDDEMYGVDLVIADMTYLVKNKDRIRGMFLTHGHEDHIGGIPYAMEQFRCPIHATRLTAGIVQLKLEEHQLQNAVHLFTHEAGEKVKAGCFTVEFIHVNHSIADAVAFAIKTPVGTVVMTGDFKIDATAEDGMIDLARFGALGKEGVLALLCDSTNVERQGYTPSERTVAGSFERQFTGCNKRIIVTTFASNAFRLQSLITVAKKFGRKVAVTGRSMENILKVSTELGYLKIPAGTLVDINQIKQIPNNKLVIVSTGSQGENMSALYRMAFSGHRQVEITASDRVIISASAIPGNEKSIGKIINELYRKGAEVIYDKLEGLHVSGHACQEELKIIHGLLKPRFFIPVHGEQRHLQAHSRLAQTMGMDPKNIFISDIGKVLLGSAKSTAKVMYIVAAAGLFAWVISYARVPQIILDVLMSISDSRAVLYFIMIAVLLVMGCLMDATPIMLITIPIFLPICNAVGINALHFGICMCVAVCIGFVTPPMGANLFVASNLSKVSVFDIARKAVPFILAFLIALLLITFVPEISMFLLQ